MSDPGDVGGMDLPSSGVPAGPVGCRGAVFVVVFVALLIALFIAMVWWTLRSVGAA